MAQYENIEVDQGTSVKYQIQLLDVGGGRRDLSGCLVRGSLKHTYASDSADAVFFLTNIDAPPTKGIINFSLNPTQTTALTKRRYVYDVELSFIDSGSNTIIERILEGKIKVNPSVTR